jgi:hypothetical protein
MLRFRSLCFLLAAGVSNALAAGELDLAKIDRTIRKEPKYVAQPRYALLAFGLQAEHRSWLILDGDNLAYLDRNGNGDLTDAEDRVEMDKGKNAHFKFADTTHYTGMNVFTLGTVAGTKLIFKLWVPNPEYDFERDETLRSSPETLAHRRLMRDRKCLNGSLMRVAADGMQAQNPLLLSARPEDAQICHFDGPLTFALKWGTKQLLEPWPKQTVFDLHIGSQNLAPADFKATAFQFAPLTTSEVPAELHPVAVFEFPPTGSDDPPTRHEVVLNQRCCGDTFYATWTLPKGASSGHVKVTVTMPLWVLHEVQPATFEVPINEGLSRFSEASYVMFHDPAIELKHALRALRETGLKATIRDDFLWISGADAGEIAVRLNRGAEVADTAKELSHKTGAAESLGQCDARFEIIPHEIEKALKQKTVLETMESSLSELTAGVVHRTWEQAISSQSQCP